MVPPLCSVRSMVNRRPGSASAASRRCDGAASRRCDGAASRRCDGAASRRCDGAASRPKWGRSEMRSSRHRNALKRSGLAWGTSSWCACRAWCPIASRRTFVSNGSGVSRGDRNRNGRLGRLREAVPVVNAIVGIDLADRKQMVVVCDHDSRVLARRTFWCKAWDLGAALDWAADRAVKTGFAGVTVACEPTGHRWRVLSQLAAERGMPFVCVQPAASSWARRTEDLTTDKTDDKDAVLIARLTGQLRCYLPEPV